MHGQGALKGRRILVVEDDAATSLLLEEVLSNGGGIVLGPVASVAQALSLIEEEAMDCAVLNHRLIDGTSHSIADTLIARGVPFVFASGFDMNGMGARYATIPVLNKVYSPNELLQAVAGLLAAPEDHRDQKHDSGAGWRRHGRSHAGRHPLELTRCRSYVDWHSKAGSAKWRSKQGFATDGEPCPLSRPMPRPGLR
jgi:CheY-like chemotaxis protein